MEWMISSSALIVVIGLLRLCLRGRISLRLQYALWGIVLLRLLVPFNPVQSQLSVLNVTREPAVQAFMESAQEPISFESDGFVADAETGEKTPVTNTHFLADRENLNDLYSLADFALDIWILGCLIVFGFMLTSNLRFVSKLRRNRVPLEKSGISMPVYVTEKVETPCLVGLIRPAIYLTPESASQERIDYVLAHEMTHCRHGDSILALLRCAALALHWYNPLVWWAAKISKQDGELACDEGTIARLGEEKRAEYGRTLLELTCSNGKSNVMLTATTMTGSKRTLKERISHIAVRPNMTAATVIVVLLVTVIAVGCTFTGAQETNPLSELTDVQLFEKLEQLEQPEEMEQLLSWFSEKTEHRNGEAWIAQRQSGKGFGYELSSARHGKLTELFSRYQWSRVTEQPETAQDAQWIDIRLEYTGEEKIQIMLQCCEEDPGLLVVTAFSYGEDGILTNVVENILLRAGDKMPGSDRLYSALLDLFIEQQADLNQSREETSVAVQAEAEDTAWVTELLEDCTMAYLIRMRTVSPTFPFDIREGELQRLLEVLDQYELVNDPSWNPPVEGGYPIMMSWPGICSMIFYDTADYIYINEFPTETSEERFAMLKAEPKGEEAENLYDTVAAIYQDAMYDEYYDRTSNRIAELLQSEMMQMGEDALTCAPEMQNWLWIEALNYSYLTIYTQDVHTVLLEGNGREIKFYEDQNLVKYTCEGESRYFFALPAKDDQSMIVDAILALLP